MPQRKYLLTSGEFYHVFNRGIARMPIFSTRNNFIHFLDMVDYYRFANTPISFSRLKDLSIELRAEMLSNLIKENKLAVEILAFCLMNNHYHFLVRQLTEKGISKWISNIQNGYAKYYNIKTERVGPLFQPMFKAIRIEKDEQLLHVSRYIHLNPSTGYLVTIKNLMSYDWTSLSCYLEEKKTFQFVSTEIISDLGNGKENYKKFIFDQASYQRELAKIKHLTLE